jgi:hypothetical protein
LARARASGSIGMDISVKNFAALREIDFDVALPVTDRALLHLAGLAGAKPQNRAIAVAGIAERRADDILEQLTGGHDIS